jgi:hypothetical protein
MPQCKMSIDEMSEDEVSVDEISNLKVCKWNVWSL